MMTARRLCQTLLAILAFGASAFAGGPLYVGQGGSIDGKPYTWDPAAMPVKYTVDPGPMSSSGAKVVIDNTAGLQRVAQMFQSWQNVPTAALSYSYAGTILAAGAYIKGADVTSAAQFNAISGSCKSAQQNPVVFDADGSLMTALGVDSNVIGFTSICATNATTGHITGAMITLNGAWLNGTQTMLTDSQFSDADHSRDGTLRRPGSLADQCRRTAKLQLRSRHHGGPAPHVSDSRLPRTQRKRTPGDSHRRCCVDLSFLSRPDLCEHLRVDHGHDLLF